MATGAEKTFNSLSLDGSGSEIGAGSDVFSGSAVGAGIDGFSLFSAFSFALAGPSQ